jgi:REP element-mobilizing transposase RayT
MDQQQNQYRRKATSVTFINYHFVWCPKRRKKVLKGDIKREICPPKPLKNILLTNILINIHCTLKCVAIHPMPKGDGLYARIFVKSIVINFVI